MSFTIALLSPDVDPKWPEKIRQAVPRLSPRYTNAHATLLFKSDGFDKTDILPAAR